MTGKKINRVACGSAHSLAWSTSKPVNAGRLPSSVPMEYSQLTCIAIATLRNRLILLHHFSDLFCPSLPMFELQQGPEEQLASGGLCGPDMLRGVLVSSAKVSFVTSFTWVHSVTFLLFFAFCYRTNCSMYHQHYVFGHEHI